MSHRHHCCNESCCCETTYGVYQQPMGGVGCGGGFLPGLGMGCGGYGSGIWILIFIVIIFCFCGNNKKWCC